MSKRILQDQKRGLNNYLGNLDNFYQPIGQPVNVYKFRKTSGIVRMTNLGERSLYYSNKLFQQTTNIYTGREPVTVVWEDSTLLTVENNKIVKNIKVGTYYKMYSTGANVNTLETNTINILSKEYVNTVINRDIVLQSNEWVPTDDDITEFVYLVLDNVNQSLQWLEILTTTPVYNEETKEFQYCEIAFTNINLKYAASGKSILDFIQFGGIGEGYVFPTEQKNKENEIVVGIDKEKLLRENDGTNQIQFDYNSGAGNSSYFIWGRKKEKMDEDGKIRFSPTQILLPYRCNYPKTSNFLYLSPNLNSYAVMNASPTKSGIWKAYKDNYKGNERIGEYNILNSKEVLTGFSCDDNAVRNTNANMNTFLNWDNMKSINFNQNLVMDANPYVKSGQVNRKLSYCEFFIINSFINFYTDVFNYEYKETTKYKLTDTFGLLGGILNMIIGGLDIGWTSVRTLAPTQPINFLLPCISFEDGKAALSPEAPLPTDIFIDDKAMNVLPTATNILTSWNFSLTDMFKDVSQVREGAEIGKGGNGIWNTKYLGQTKFEDGTWINEDQTPFKMDLQYMTPSFPSTTDDFIIDFVDYKVVGYCDMRISAYNKADENIYSALMETNAKARKEITLWGNAIKFNYYDEFNTIGQATWPETAKPPKPDIEKYSYKLNETINFNFINWNFDATNTDAEWNGNVNSKISASPDDLTANGAWWRYIVNRVFTPPTDNPYLSLKNQKVTTSSVNCDVSEINMIHFDRIKLTLSNGETIIKSFKIDSEATMLENQNFIFFEEFSYKVWSEAGTTYYFSTDKNLLLNLETNFKNTIIDFKLSDDYNTLTINFTNTIERANIHQFTPNTNYGNTHRVFIPTYSKGQITKSNLFNPFRNLFVVSAYLIPKGAE